MNRFRNSHCRLVLVFGLFVASTLSVHAVDELWERSEQFVRESAVWLPGKVETHQYVVDSKGKQLSENVMRFVITQDAERGGLQGSLEQRLENGEDRTEASRMEVEAEFQKQLEKVAHDMPFHLDHPSQAITGLRDKAKQIGEIECMGYEFEVTVAPDPDQPSLRFEGVVWVDPTTAVPLRIESHLLDLPRKQDDAEIMSLVLQRSYDQLGGAWIPMKEQQEIWLNARSIFKRSVVYVTATTEFREHWKWELRH